MEGTATRVALPALLVCALALAGCGSGGGDSGTTATGSAVREALLSGPCPAPYLLLRADRSYSAPAVRRARERDHFEVHEVKRRLEPPVDWLQDPYGSKAFRGRLADLGWIEVLLFAYRENGDVGALRQARDLALDWIARQPREGEATSDKSWGDKIVGGRVVRLGYLARAAACEELLDPNQLDLFARSLAEHAAVLSDPAVYRPTNHGLYMDLSLFLLSRQLEPGAPSAWRELALERFARTFLTNVVEDEGFWLEHSASYHFLLTNLLAKALKMPGFESSRLDPVLERMREVAGWLSMPDGGIPQFGHSSETRAPRFARHRGRHQSGLLALPGTGLAVVKEPGSYLSTVAMFHGVSHKQADELSFDLYDGGARIVSDSGLYHKDRDRFYAFAGSASAHSTLTVDGEDFSLDEERAYGSGLLAAGRDRGWYAILARNPLLRPVGVVQRRLFLYRPGEALIVADRVRSNEEHTYRRRFQLGPEVRVLFDQAIAPRTGFDHASGPFASDSIELQAEDKRVSLTSFSPAERERVDAARGERHPLAGFTFPSFRERVPRWTLSYVSSAEDADYVSVFDIRGAGLQGTQLQLTPRVWKLQLRDNAGNQWAFRVRRDGEKLSITAVR